jgi:hypothetical protein
MLYSKNGSIPKAETDGTEGWIEVPDAPDAPEGKEVVWWYPPSEQWVEYALPETVVEVEPLTSTDISALTSGDISALTTSQISAL